MSKNDHSLKDTMLSCHFFSIFLKKPPVAMSISGQKNVNSVKLHYIMYYGPKKSIRCLFFPIFHEKINSTFFLSGICLGGWGPRGPGCPVVLKLSRCQMGFLRRVRFLETELPITTSYMETSWAIKVTKSSKPQSNWAWPTKNIGPYGLGPSWAPFQIKKKSRKIIKNMLYESCLWSVYVCFFQISKALEIWKFGTTFWAHFFAS